MATKYDKMAFQMCDILNLIYHVSIKNLKENKSTQKKSQNYKKMYKTDNIMLLLPKGTKAPPVTYFHILFILFFYLSQ